MSFQWSVRTCGPTLMQGLLRSAGLESNDRIETSVRALLPPLIWPRTNNVFFYDGLVGVVVDAVPRARGKYTKMDGVKGQLRHPCSARYSQQYDARRRRPFVGHRHAARAAPALGPPPLCRKWLSVFLFFVRETNRYNWLRPRHVVSATALGASTKQKPLQ